MFILLKILTCITYIYNIIRQLWNYCKLGYQLNSLHREYKIQNSIDTQNCHLLIDDIHKQILNCGATCIKFAQWLLPILDNIYIEEKINLIGSLH